MRHIYLRRPAVILAALALSLAALLPRPLSAQNLFDPVATVNDRVITQFELDQRIRFLELLNAPGDLQEFALQALIDERLQIQAADRLGIELTPEQVRAGMEEFASRGDLDADQFLQALAQEGIAPETFEAFVSAGLLWREVVGSRFGPRAQVTEAEVDRAIALNTVQPGGVRVLMSEIVLPATDPRQRAMAEDLARQITQIRSFEAFADAARTYSAASTRTRGGRLEWLPLGNVPPPVANQLLTLSPGEVTDPVPVPNAIALFQLRAIEETGVPRPDTVAVEFARYFIPGGRTEAALREAAQIEARVDTCDDLYGVARGQPAERLARDTVPMSELSGEIAAELQRLDPGEVSTSLVTADGQTLVFLMLCGRTQAVEEEVDRNQVREQLYNQRLASYATGYLAELRADAVIDYP